MLVNPCNLSLNTSNTGIECQSALSVTAMLIWVPTAATFTHADIDAAGSFTELVKEKSHLPEAQRWFPMFGFAAPINSITENNETDVIETLDDGSSVFVRYGKYNRTFLTTKGGLCFAAHLMAFPGDYSFIEVDQQGKVQVYESSTGVYAGVPVNMVKGLGPTLATFSTTFKNRLMISFDPVAYIQQGKIFASDSTENILGSKGLLDVNVSNFSAPSAASNTAPGGGTVTFTNVGADNDTVQISVNGVDISGTVIKTSSESTVTLLAVKVKDAINALTGTNGGITATNVAGALTIVIPASYGSSLNTLLPIVTIVGTIASTNVAFSAGAYGAVTFQVDVKTECAETNLVALYPGTTDPGLVQAANFVVERDGTSVTPTVTLVNVSGQPDHIQIVVASSTTAGSPDITIDLAAPATLMAHGVEYYDGVTGISYTV